MTEFTPVASAIGGLLIGLSSAIVLVVLGRIAGISGITGTLLRAPSRAETPWRLAFVIGLISAGIVFAFYDPSSIRMDVPRTKGALIAAGLLVGFGTRLGSGCTSGHGVCGIGRLSTRSVTATMTFMFTGALTVYIVRVYFGGVI